MQYLTTYIRTAETNLNKFLNLDSNRWNTSKGMYSKGKIHQNEDLRVFSTKNSTLAKFVDLYEELEHVIKILEKLNSPKAPIGKYLNIAKNGRWCTKLTLQKKSSVMINEEGRYYSEDPEYYKLFESIKEVILNHTNTELVEDDEDDSIKTRQIITRSFRRGVWESINGNNDEGICFTCTKDLSRKSDWHCGHICSDNKGGDIEQWNMKPLCNKCNLAMKQQHMYLWMLLNNKKCASVSKEPSYKILNQIADMKVQAVKDLSKLAKANKIDSKTKKKYIYELNLTSISIDKMLSIFDFIHSKL